MTHQKLSIWYHETVIFVQLANGEVLQFPECEPSRLVAFLRLHGTAIVAARNREAEWEHAIRRQGERQRAAHEARKAKERADVAKRDAKYMAKKDAEELLAIVGL